MIKQIATSEEPGSSSISRVARYLFKCQIIGQFPRTAFLGNGKLLRLAKPVKLNFVKTFHKHMPKEMNKKALFNSASKSWEAGNLQLAFKLFEQAANLGDTDSQVNLGYFYDEGIYVRKNWNKALYYYKKASALGHGSAANNIAIHYKSRHEYRKALWWFHRAARLSNHDVFLNIAYLYEKGQGVKKNPKIAARFYRKTIFAKFVTEDSKEKAKRALKKIK